MSNVQNKLQYLNLLFEARVSVIVKENDIGKRITNVMDSIEESFKRDDELQQKLNEAKLENEKRRHER